MDVLYAFHLQELSACSKYGDFIATTHKSWLTIWSSAETTSCDVGTIVRRVELRSPLRARCKYLRWANSSGSEIESANSVEEPAPTSHRLLVANDETVHIYDLNDPVYHATVQGASGSVKKLANVDFGYTPDEVLIFTDFGVKLTIWDLATSKGVEIRDPKFPIQGHSFRSDSGHLAVLTRTNARDVVMVLAPGTRKLLANFWVSTADAQGILWSPDGRWIVVWDAPSTGNGALVYTADGHLFKVCQGDTDIGLGVGKVEWDPAGNFLIMGTYDDRITLLRSDNFAVAAIFEHKSIITTKAVVWQEQIDASQQRNYIVATQPAYPPGQSGAIKSDANKSTSGISQMTFNADGSLLVTRSDSYPTTIYIWSLQTLSIVAFLIHHSPVRTATWHPTNPDLLMIQCVTTTEPILHFWSPSWPSPRIMTLPLENPGPRVQAQWTSSSSTVTTTAATHTATAEDRDEDQEEGQSVQSLIYGNTRTTLLARLRPSGSSVRNLIPPTFPSESLKPLTQIQHNDRNQHRNPAMLAAKGTLLGPDDRFDEGNSLNSLNSLNSMEFSPIKLDPDGYTAKALGMDEKDENDTSTVEFGEDDTFGYKRQGVGLSGL